MKGKKISLPSTEASVEVAPAPGSGNLILRDPTGAPSALNERPDQNLDIKGLITSWSAFVLLWCVLRLLLGEYQASQEYCLHVR